MVLQTNIIYPLWTPSSLISFPPPDIYLSYVLRKPLKRSRSLLDDLSFAIMVPFPKIYSFHIPLLRYYILSPSDVWGGGEGALDRITWRLFSSSIISSKCIIRFFADNPCLHGFLSKRWFPEPPVVPGIGTLALP